MNLPQPGDVILLKYRVVEQIGSGSFGVVYRGESELGRPVAIKVLKPATASYELQNVARFMRELKAVSRLTSPHTPKLYNFGKTETGLLAMVTEYVHGQDLSQLLRQRGTLTEAEVVHIIIQILHSLEEAHTTGVLHRDIKPANVRIGTHLDDQLYVKVLDFGLAKSFVSHGDTVTEAGFAMGTPRYMSPEQLTESPLTPSTDIYGVAVLALELLLGQSAPELKALPQPFNDVSPPASVSPVLHTWLTTALRNDPAQRFQTAREAIEHFRPPDLRRTTPQVVPEPPASHNAATERLAPPEPAPKPQRHVALAVAAVALLVGGAGAGLWVANRVETEPPKPRPAPTSKPLPTALLKSQTAAVLPDAAAEISPDRGTSPPSTGGACQPAPFRLFGSVSRDDDAAVFPTYVPKSLDDSRPAPVILFVPSTAAVDNQGRAGKHPKYLGGKQPLQRGEQLVIDVAEASGAIVLYVDQHPTVKDKHFTDLPADLLFVAIDAAAETFCVDEDRLFLMSANWAADYGLKAACELGVRGWITSGGYPWPSRSTRDRCKINYMQLLEEQDKSNVPKFAPLSGCHNNESRYRDRVLQPWLTKACTHSASDGCETLSCADDLVVTSCSLDTGRLWPPVSSSQSSNRHDAARHCYGDDNISDKLADQIAAFIATTSVSSDDGKE